MAKNKITRAILEVVRQEYEVSSPGQLNSLPSKYTVGRRVQGWVRNKYRGGKRFAFGGGSDAKSRAKQVGRHAIKGAPKALGAGAKKIPVVGSLAGLLVEKGSQIGADKVVAKIDQKRIAELRDKEDLGTLTVREMTEMLHKEGSFKVSADFIGKLHDAIRKLDQAYSKARRTIIKADQNPKCWTAYKAAKRYTYLKYRIMRLQMYVAVVNEHMAEIEEATDRYAAQVIGFEEDLVGALDDYFESASGSDHAARCDKEFCLA